MNSTHISLLQRLQSGSDPSSWSQLLDLYKPLIWGWLRRQNTPIQDAEDLSHEVLAVVVKELPGFIHNGRKGAFRAWLRTITANRLRVYWRSGKGRESSTDWQNLADQLEDVHSDLAQEWDRQHDHHVASKLLEQMAEEFEPKTLLAFRRVALDEAKAEDVANELGMSVTAVYIAKSRVLRRLREMAEMLLD
jgi:RNA polymerase sigma-70 factor (ECF subfamily)